MLFGLFWLAVAYVLGSIPFGLVIARTFCSIDPREEGSRNTGATNVARLCGFGYGVMVLAADVLKGWLPVMVALSVSDSVMFASLTALAAIGGHVFSCFMNFTGGKAVATTVGAFMAIAFWPLFWSAALCIGVIAVSGYVSLGSLTLVTALPVMLFLGGEWGFIPLALAVMALIFWRHRENITRLARGEEKPWRKGSRNECSSDEQV